MKTCIYDNPKTERRELWEDGRCRSGIYATSVGSDGPAPWCPGRIIGDPLALRPPGTVQ